MKVKELIRVLKKCNQNLEVMIIDSEDNVLCDVSNVYRVITTDKNKVLDWDYAWAEQEFINGNHEHWWNIRMHYELLNSRQVIQLTFKSKIYQEQSIDQYFIKYKYTNN